MQKKVFKAENGLKGTVVIPSDKSISHRAVIFASIAKGKSVIKNFSKGQDPISSLNICKALGVDIELNNDLIVKSSGIFNKPKKALDCGNSGTTMRLMTGVLAGQGFDSELIGDQSLSKRPMKRIIEPLAMMGADINSFDYHAPLKIKGQRLCGVEYNSKLASAQVKSCILLAGLYADGITSFTEPYLSRNHSEIMLKYMGADVTSSHNTVMIKKSKLSPCEIEIPGDISSAAYFIVSALITPKSDLIIKNVGLNPTRTGIIDVVKSMGGDIEILDERESSGEKIGDIRVKYSKLKACTIEKELIPRLIDELPVIAVLATQAAGKTVVKDAQDLRNKESDRIKTIVNELSKLGADISETEDGFIVNGKKNLNGGCELETYHDHRLAMSFFVAALICNKPILINGFEWVRISFPEFEKIFKSLL